MSDHLAEALGLLDRLSDCESATVEAQMTAEAQVHATLDVAEHVEFAGEQLRRLADGVEALVDLLRARYGGPDADEPDEAPDAAPPCGNPMHDQPQSPRCLLPAGHEDYHFDGHGNRWVP